MCEKLTTAIIYTYFSSSNNGDTFQMIFLLLFCRYSFLFMSVTLQSQKRTSPSWLELHDINIFRFRSTIQMWFSPNFSFSRHCDFCMKDVTSCSCLFEALCGHVAHCLSYIIYNIHKTKTFLSNYSQISPTK